MTDGGTGGDIPSEGRVLAVDVGDVRVGLAATDATQTIASPDETLQVEGLDVDGLAGRTAAAVAERDVVGIVVGWPRTLEGRERENATRARKVAEALSRETGLPVQLWDERFSSIEAERVMLDQDASRAERRQSLDRVAASVILQGWLESRRRNVR